MQPDEPVPEQSRYVTPVNSSNWKRAAIVLATTALLAGTGGYLVGTNRSTSQYAEKALLQHTEAVISPTPIPGSTANWKTYKNEKLGFKFKYPESYHVMEETENGVSFGNDVHTYLTISINQIKDYKSYPLCKDADIYPCLDSGEGWKQKGDIVETTLGGVSAKSFYISEGPGDGNYHIVQTTDSPKIEAIMYVSGGGLDGDFEQMLSTLEVLNDM